MISPLVLQLRRIVAASALLIAAGCQGPVVTERTHEWVGTLPRRDTGFDRRTWQDTSASTVQQLIARLPEHIDSAAGHRLARNLLISITDAPQGDDGNGELLALRVAALMRIGNAGDAAALARAGRIPPRDETSARREAEAELLAGNVEMGCIDLRALAARSSAGWVEDGVALCRARAGEPGVVAPSGTDRLGALARIAGAPLPSEQPADSPAGTAIAYQAAVGSDPKVPMSHRLAAAFAAARASALSGEAYAKILRSAHGQGSPGEGPLVTGEQAAALFRAIEGAGDPGRKLALAERGLLSPDGAVDGVGAAMAQALRGAKPEGGPLAARFAAYFYAVGDAKAATPWSDLAKRSAADTAWPYRALAMQPGEAEFAQWQKRAHLDPARQERIAAILSAFGVGTGNASEPSQDGYQELDGAAAQQHVGETTLRALTILGTGGPAAASPQTLHHVLAALDRVNLHDEARAIAWEAIAAALVTHPASHKGDVATAAGIGLRMAGG